MTTAQPLAPTVPADQDDGPAAGDARHEGSILDSATLLRGARCVLIVHNGATYRLRATRAGKLILTK